MELHYEITKQDYIDFNLHYYMNNAVVQRSLLITRIMTAVLVLIGGTLLMYWVEGLGVLSTAVYLALAAVCFFGTPWYMKRKVAKNTERILRNANNKQLCGPKTLILRETDFELKGENEDTVYQYEAVQRTATDEGHYYIFVDEFSGLIIPFTAFENEGQKRDFYDRITACITDEALKC
ncbi:MAG: YcxB family protein [Eubacteriales bacterium]|nr:YcxB family protein [Eubacteriales bacterium]